MSKNEGLARGHRTCPRLASNPKCTKSTEPHCREAKADRLSHTRDTNHTKGRKSVTGMASSLSVQHPLAAAPAQGKKVWKHNWALQSLHVVG